MIFIMLKMGRACVHGHRMEVTVIQLWILLCWLIPVALELTLRRWVLSELLSHRVVQAALLGGSFLLNRLLLAPAHLGYHQRCHQLALQKRADKAATCELPAVTPSGLSDTGMRAFFREYRHPIRAMKWQLRWDALRAGGYFIALIPGLLLLAIGARDTAAVWQATLGGGGFLLMIAGLLLMWWWLRRLTPVLYRRPQDRPFWSAIGDAYRSTRRKTGALIRPFGWYFLLWPLFICPVLPFRAAFYTEQAALCQRWRAPVKVSSRARLFHTRVLNET